MNFKTICLALISIFIISCDDDTIEIFDHAGQYVIEKPVLEDYLQTHYFDVTSNEIKSIDASQTALIDDENLQTLTTTNNEVDYEMYGYVYEEGSEGSPDADDTVNVYYKAILLSDGSQVDESTSNDSFLNLASTITGWQTGMQIFKGGTSNEDDINSPRKFENTGKGFLIIPSGLAYQNFGSGSILPNEALLFKIELRTAISVGEDLGAE